MAHLHNSATPPVNNKLQNNNDDINILANLCTYAEGGKMINRHPNTIRNMVERGELEGRKIGRTPYVFKDELIALGKRKGH